MNKNVFLFIYLQIELNIKSLLLFIVIKKT